MPVKSGVNTGLWWYDAERAATLARVIDNLELGETPQTDTPGWGTIAAWLLAGLAAAILLLRRALRAKT
jgi:hypothetical protein